VDLSEIRRRAVKVDEYIDSLKEPFKEKFLVHMQTYQLQMQLVDQLKTRANDFMMLVFSASWCKDCSQYVPVLALIAGRPGLEVRVFGGLKRDPLSHISKWRIPPSPPEVLDFGVDKIPLMIIFDLEGREIGRIIESPKRYPTLEQELCEIIKCQ
jgi:hypothetical protein